MPSSLLTWLLQLGTWLPHRVQSPSLRPPCSGDSTGLLQEVPSFLGSLTLKTMASPRISQTFPLWLFFPVLLSQPRCTSVVSEPSHGAWLRRESVKVCGVSKTPLRTCPSLSPLSIIFVPSVLLPMASTLPSLPLTPESPVLHL